MNKFVEFGGGGGEGGCFAPGVIGGGGGGSGNGRAGDASELIMEHIVGFDPPVTHVMLAGLMKATHAEYASQLAAKDAQIAELREAVILVRGIIKDAAPEGFNPMLGDWASRLYRSQHDTRAALEMSGGGEVSAEWQPIETAPKDGTIILFPDRKWGVMPVKWNPSNSPGWVTHGGYPRESNLWHPMPEPPR